ncbi:phosphotransferase [bacterium]|nr:phosphotransferase [bacterium]
MKSPELSNNFKYNPEEQIERLLDEAGKILPYELNQDYIDQYENLETDQEIEQLLLKIKSALEHRRKKSSEKLPQIDNDLVFNNCTEKEFDQIKKQIESLKQKIEAGQLPSLGEGRVAEVFPGWEGSPFCFKMIKNNNESINIYKSENNIKEEIGFMEKVIQEVNVEGVRIPQPYYYQATPKIHFIAMETLDAVTLEEAMKDSKKFPKNFDAEKFFNSLENFIIELNKKNIFHRDLHKGNIMVDKNNGLCYIIDFGTAVHHIDEEEAFKKTDPKTNNIIRTTSDINNVKNHKRDYKNAFNNI